MKLRKLGPNKTEVILDDGTVIFFSYNTPVAASLSGRGLVRTSARYSVTTSKHINQWLGGAKAEEVPQATLEALARG